MRRREERRVAPVAPRRWEGNYPLDLPSLGVGPRAGLYRYPRVSAVPPRRVRGVSS